MSSGMYDPVYAQKLEKLQRYIPFLQKMISKLDGSSDANRAAQLRKMKHLLAILTDTRRRLKDDLLVKCEEVLKKLHDKVEGEFDEDVQELPRPQAYDMSNRPCTNPQDRVLYPVSEWERPSPPRETFQQPPPSGRTSPLSEDIIVESPPLSSFVERIRMSSPSSFGASQHPRSPSPEVVAQIPGAFTNLNHSKHRFEKGREILRKLMDGMEKTLDDSGVDKEPLIIPLERKCHASFLSNEYSDGFQVSDASKNMTSLDERVDELRLKLMKTCPTESSVKLRRDGEGDVYDPEDEWHRPSGSGFRPPTIVHPPLSKADLEELNKDLRRDQSVLPTSNERSSEENSSRKSSGSAHKHKHKHKHRRRDSHSSDKLPGVNMDVFDVWKKREKVKLREKIKMERVGQDGNGNAPEKAPHVTDGSLGDTHSTVSSVTTEKHQSTKSSDTILEGRESHCILPDVSPSSNLPRKVTEFRQSNTASKRNYSSGIRIVKRSDSESSSIASHLSVGTNYGQQVESNITDVSIPSNIHISPFTPQETVAEHASERSGKNTFDEGIYSTRHGVSLIGSKPASASPADPRLHSPVQPKVFTAESVNRTMDTCSSSSNLQLAPLLNKLEDTYSCLLIKNLTKNTLRQDIFQLFTGFGMVETVLQVDFSYLCTGIAYAQFADHEEAKGAREHSVNKTMNGQCVKLSPCADGIYLEAKRAFEKAMNDREVQFSKRADNRGHVQHSQDQRNYHGSSNIQRPTSPAVSDPRIRAGTAFAPRVGVFNQTRNVRPNHSRGESVKGPSYNAPDGQQYRHTNSLFPKTSSPAHQKHSHQYVNPYNVKPGQVLPPKHDPRVVAKLAYEAAQRKRREEELLILRKHRGGMEKRVIKSSRSSYKGGPVKSRGLDYAVKTAALGTFKIPKLKKAELPSNESKPELEPVVDSQSLPGSSGDGTQSYDIGKIGTVKQCHQEDVVSSTVDTETLIYPHGKKYSRKLSSESDSESERICTSGTANENECIEANNSKSPSTGTSCGIVMKQAVVLLSKTTADTSDICSGSIFQTDQDESSKMPAKRVDDVRKVSVSSEEMDCLQVDVYEDELSDESLTEVESNDIVHGMKGAIWEQTQTKKDYVTNELNKQEPKHSDDSGMIDIVGRETALAGKPNSAEYEALKNQERKAKEKVEREFKEFAEREAKKRAYRETKAKAELETIESMELEVRKKAEMEAREKAELKAREQAELEVRENDERQEREKAERQVREMAEREVRENAERQERETAERVVSKKAEREAREEDARKAIENAEREARTKAEREVKEAKEKALRVEEAEKLARLQAELEARAKAELEAHERAEQLKEEQRLELERNKPIEPEECHLCSYSGKKIVGHYITCHPGKHIPVKLSAILIQDLSNEELGPGDNSTYKQLSEELENQLLNDDLSWIPTSLMFEFCIACPYCKFTAMNRRHMLQHIANHLRSGKSAPEEYSMKCRFCKVKSVNTLEIYDHLTSHTGEYRYSCGVCGFRVFRMYFLKIHMSSYHKGHDQCDINLDNVEFDNDWIYGFACKLCGFVQLNKARVVNHMKLHHPTEQHDIIRINMVTKGPKLDIARRVVDARRRKKAWDEKVAAAQPAPIENMSAFMVSEEFIREELEMVDARKTVMCNVLSGFDDKSRRIIEDDKCHKFMLKCIELCDETPQGYLRSVRDRRALSTQLSGKDIAVEESQLPTTERSGEVEVFEYSPVHWDSDSDSLNDLDMRPPLYHTLEAMSFSDSDSRDLDKRLLVRLAKRVAPAVVASPSVSLSSADGECLSSVKQESGSSAALNTDTRAAEGLSSMSEDLESLLQDFDAFEQEQQSSSLRIRKLSGDVLSADAGSGGLLISSVMSLSESNNQLPSAVSSKESTFDFPADGADRPWKFFLTLKDPSKVIRLMFHMHHKSAYKCSAVHCSFTTNNGTLFKLHLRNHERCDICVPSSGAGLQKHTCMNTRQVCVYCGYRGDDLAEHVYRRHAVSPFQCGYCFYRTRQNAYMHEHQRRWHGDMPTYFLQSDRANPPPGLNADHMQEAQLIAESSLTPYVCAQHGCGRTFIKAGVFMQHCQESHPFAVDFPCHICHKHMNDFSSMIQHYIEHGFVAYNCAYCTYAHQQEGNMKIHLIDVHPDEPPKCYARIPKGLCESAGTSGAGSAVLLPALLQVKQELVAALPSVSPAQPDLQLSESQSSTANFPSDEPRLSESEPSAAAGAVELQEAGDDQLQPTEQQELLAEQLYRCGGGNCSARSQTVSAFKEHVLQCQSQQVGPLLQCFHCPKQVKHISSLLEHVRLHGPRRYQCALCEFRAPVANYVSKHLKQNHRITGCSVLPADARRHNPERDEYVVYPRHCVPRLVQPAAEQLLEQTVDQQTPQLFGPNQLSELPRRAVLFRAAGCRLCDYRTHITRNLRKHLLRHGGEEEPHVPALVDPVNPRPCVGRSTRMSDMAVNLASCSKEVDEEPPLAVCQPRDVISDADMQRLPKEVSEDKRYVCSIKDCNYLTLNDTMLKYHIQALHGQMITYPCPHCADLYMMPDRLSNHLRFHGPRLYKCRYCIYNHYQRKLVLRHVRDRHPLLAISDLVVREPPEDETAERRPTLKPWRCGLCRHQTAAQADMVEHVATAHDMRSQFKCALCSVRSSVRSAFQLHFASRHPDQPVKVFSVYYRVEEGVPTATPHQQLLDRCRPLWRRDDPRRIRHARGILIEQVRTPSKRRPAGGASKRNSPLKRAFVTVVAENPIKPEDGPKKRRLCFKTEQTKRSRAVVKRALDKTRQRSLRPRPASGQTDTDQLSKTEPVDAISQLDDAKPSATTSQLNDATTLSLNAAERVAATSATSQLEKSRQIPASSGRTVGGDSPPDQELLQFYETKSRDLGPTGSADLVNRLMVCPRCNKYKSKKPLDMRNHLFKEFSYNRFLCGNCGHTNTTMVNVRRHHEASHKGWPESITRLSPDAGLEAWVEALIDAQQQQLSVSDAEPQVDSQLPKPASTQLSFTPEELVTPAASQPLTGATESSTPDDNQQRLKCLECGQEGSIVELKLHKRQEHAGQPLRVTPLDSYRHVCTVCGKAWLRRWSIRKHLAKAHPEAAPTAFRRELCHRNRTYRCLACSAEFANRFLALQHCRQLHPDVQPPPVRMLAGGGCSDSSSAARSVACPRCPFVAKSVASMGVHLMVHFKRFKCAHCALTAASRTLVLQHIQQRHAGLTPAVHELEQVSSEYSAVRRQLRAAHIPPSPSAVARKSTARGRRCVAVKSTGGSPRQTGFSYYGTTPPAPSHFSQVTSQLVLAGGVAMRVNLPTLNQIFKLYPIVKVTDVKRAAL